MEQITDCLRHGKISKVVQVTLTRTTLQRVEGIGEAFTLPLLFKHGNHYTKESCKIGPLEGDIDMVLPWWWLTVHKPTGWFEGSTSFIHEDYSQKCTLENSKAFSIEYDPSIPEIASHESSAVCCIGTMVQTPDGSEIKSLREALLRRYGIINS
jgi:hypothetical protein